MLESEKLSAIFIKGLANCFANHSTRMLQAVQLLCTNFSAAGVSHTDDLGKCREAFLQNNVNDLMTYAK
jgi:hypothetical protein